MRIRREDETLRVRGGQKAESVRERALTTLCFFLFFLLQSVSLSFVVVVVVVVSISLYEKTRLLHFLF